MTFQFIITIPIILAFFGTILFMLEANTKIKSTSNNKNSNKHMKVFRITLLTIACVCGIISSYLLIQANKTGLAHREDFRKTTIQEFLKHKDKTFKQTTNNKKDLPPKALIVLYRYGCLDCEKNHDELKALKDKVPTHYVESRSEFGKKLVKQYNVKFVPSILLWDDHSDDYQHIEIKDLKNNNEEQETVKEMMNEILLNH